MRRWMGIGLAVVLVSGVAGCKSITGDLEERVAALEASMQAVQGGVGVLDKWASLMDMDANPNTNPGSSEDPAYAYVQFRAICRLMGQVEELHSLDPAERATELMALCGPPGGDPLFPPGYPPET